jgi:hypothetical protein
LWKKLNVNAGTYSRFDVSRMICHVQIQGRLDYITKRVFKELGTTLLDLFGNVNLVELHRIGIA